MVKCSSKTVLVVAAHPDDEVLGCAGSLMKHVAQGDIVHVLFMGNGVSSRIEPNSSEVIAQRKEMAEKAQSIMGVNSNYYLDFPDNAMDTVPFIDIVRSIEEKVCYIKPEVIYTHFHADLNIDHQLTYKAVMTACRPQPGSSVCSILCFEVNSATEWSATTGQTFSPNYYVDITTYIKKKKQALLAYEHELRKYPHTRSLEAIEAKDKVRGATVGTDAAEAFHLVRSIS
jgi:LmbE family N-acetylglucosaminyl deacetylase